MIVRRVLKTLFLTVVIISAIIAALITALPFLISTDSIRIRLAQDLSAWSGYDVQLRAPPHISIFPAFQASLSGVTLTDSTDNSSPLMEAERIEVDLSLFDALQGRVSFSETRIIRPHFIIDEPVKTVAGFFTSLSKSDGSLGIAIREAQELVKQAPENPDASRLLAQPFGRILIEDGTLTYPLDNTNTLGNITNISAIIDWPGATHAASLRANARWNGALTDVTFDARQALILMGGGLCDIRFSVNSNRGGITFTGKARFARTFLLKGRINSRSPGWKTTMEWLNRSTTFAANIQAPVVWESNLDASQDRIELNDIDFTLGNDRARGALETVFQKGLPVTSGSLAFQTLDLEKIIPAFASLANGDPDLSFLDDFGLDIRLSATEAGYRDIAMTNFAASTQIRNSRLVFDIGNAQLFNGTAQTNIQITRKDDDMALESRFSAANIDMSQLQKALGYTTVLDASAGANLFVATNFKSWAELMHNATGEASFNLGSGTLKRFDIEAFIAGLFAGKRFPLRAPDDSSFTFDRVDAKARIEGGTLDIDPAKIRFGEHIIELAGKIPLVQGRLDLIGTIDRPQQSNGRCPDTLCIIRSLTTPPIFQIKGSWGNLTSSFVPDSATPDKASKE